MKDLSLDDIIIETTAKEIANMLIQSEQCKCKKIELNKKIESRYNTISYMFQRVYRGNFYTLLVVENPNNILIKNKTLHKLKVVQDNVDSTSLAKCILYTQILMWLSGIENGCIDVYRIKDNRLYECYERIKIDKDLLRKAFNDYVFLKIHHLVTTKVYKELILGKSD